MNNEIIKFVNGDLQLDVTVLASGENNQKVSGRNRHFQTIKSSQL